MCDWYNHKDDDQRILGKESKQSILTTSNQYPPGNYIGWLLEQCQEWTSIE